MSLTRKHNEFLYEQQFPVETLGSLLSLYRSTMHQPDNGTMTLCYWLFSLLTDSVTPVHATGLFRGFLPANELRAGSIMRSRVERDFYLVYSHRSLATITLNLSKLEIWGTSKVHSFTVHTSTSSVLRTMSGVEIVGLLLGCLPLAISALENYRNGLDPLKDYFRYDRTLKSLRTRLRLQEDLYKGTLQRLLVSELSETQASTLFRNSEHGVDEELWASKEIGEKLQRKLGDRYATFMDVIGEMQAIMTKLMYKLDIDIQGKVGKPVSLWKKIIPSLILLQPKSNEVLSGPTQSRKRLQWEWRRVRRSFGRTERRELLLRFERYNGDIAAYVEQNEILAPSPERQPGWSLAHLDLVRDQVCGLYEALEDGWRCTCLDVHNANLKLG